MKKDPIRLTQFSPGAGCGCKISPSQLHEILAADSNKGSFPGLLVGNESNDDAAVFDLGNGKAVISTTDFFTPIVDDPYDFGRIAAANAISDVYAMGGSPLLAIAILGWPLDKLPTDVAGKVTEGARAVCKMAGIPLAGGHSIDISDPVFGLAVTGQVLIKNLKMNATATANCKLYLTKPLGIGLITTAEKRGLAREEDRIESLSWMTTLNNVGEYFGSLPIVKAMTDVTGFGLAGHLLEMCEGSGVDAEINGHSIPLISGLDHYLKLGTIPGGTNRNYKSYGMKISPMETTVKNILCDPQTSGGLMVAVESEHSAEFERLSAAWGCKLLPIGQTVPTLNQTIRINVK